MEHMLVSFSTEASSKLMDIWTLIITVFPFWSTKIYTWHYDWCVVCYDDWNEYYWNHVLCYSGTI